jgi:hypothetical protein
VAFVVFEVCVSRLLGLVSFTMHYGPNWDLPESLLVKLLFQCHCTPSALSKIKSLTLWAPETRKTKLTLNETRQDLASRLQKRMSYNNLQKPLKTLPSVLNNIITKPVRKHLPRQRWDRNTSALSLQNVAEVLKV